MAEELEHGDHPDHVEKPVDQGQVEELRPSPEETDHREQQHGDGTYRVRALKAIEQKVARITLTKEQLYKKASDTIRKSRQETQLLMEKGLIATYKE